jgi:SAM-dependent methyltransferase
VGGIDIRVGAMTATVAEHTTPTPSPLHFEPDGAFDTVRAVLRDADYTESEICRRLELDSIDQFRAIRDGRPSTPPRDAHDALVMLFLDGEALLWSEAEALLKPNGVAALGSLGLVRAHRTDPSRVVSNVLLYPTESLHLASDVASIPDGGGARWWDLVYAAITTNSRNFVATMPRTRSAAFLDLCSGTGVAALLAAQSFADHAWAIDVAERSTEFARFNARLNGISNVTALSGDLYAAVAGLTFDRIVAHPPYVPARENTLIYRDAGSDGEDVTRRIVAGLAEHLRTGGYFHCSCRATDRRDAPLEQRLRSMLGDAADEFDIALAVIDELDPTEYYVRLAIAGRCTWAEAEQWHNHFAGLGVTKMVYGTIAMIRQQRPHAPFSIRRRVGKATGWEEVGRLVAAAEEAASTGGLERMLAARPMLQPGVALRSEHVVEDGGWAMRACSVATDVAFDVRLPCPREFVALISGMDGSRTVRELYETVAAAAPSTDDASLEGLASYIHLLAAHGIVSFVA